VAGKPRFWDVEYLAGGDLILTMPPYVLEPLLRIGDDLAFTPEAIAQEPPAEIMDRLLQIPYVIQACDPNGASLEQFDSHPSTIYTLENFSKASEGLDAYVGRRLEAVRGLS
jgi:hypothetical protein